MHLALVQLIYRLRTLIQQESGQDLVEYALVVALVAFGATAGMGALAGGINTAFNNISTKLAGDITSILF